MSIQAERLQALTLEQRELIKKLFTENRRLSRLTQTLQYRIKDLVKQHIVIDREIAEIPFDMDLVPENDLYEY